MDYVRTKFLDSQENGVHTFSVFYQSRVRKVYISTDTNKINIYLHRISH